MSASAPPRGRADLHPVTTPIAHTHSTHPWRARCGQAGVQLPRGASQGVQHQVPRRGRVREPPLRLHQVWCAPCLNPSTPAPQHPSTPSPTPDLLPCRHLHPEDEEALRGHTHPAQPEQAQRREPSPSTSPPPQPTPPLRRHQPAAPTSCVVDQPACTQQRGRHSPSAGALLYTRPTRYARPTRPTCRHRT